ncbi:prostaglandin reductase 1-like [Onthophagus taurus]|uniref:prostaglandin reductase 1-like n=1 Tax=Onthophagus taurus TaxID=166361 RepID=UPI000C1FE667|nr:prostaglandin reductase 1-like [Onthophagus taurus]
MVVAKKFIYVKPFVGMPTADNVQIVEENLPEIKEGEFLAEAVYLSVDPYMRAYSNSYTLGQQLEGGQVAKIIESKNPQYPVGKHVMAYFGWRTHSIYDGTQRVFLIPDETIPLSYYLGIVGMPGVTAYFGTFDILKPQSGETIVVTCAGGAVGSQVGQLGKIKGCNVVGIAGTDEKLDWLKKIGFDQVINYKKTPNLGEALKKAAPNGVDCYFDNVGGEMASTIIAQMNPDGRIAVCGAISAYNDIGEPVKATPIQRYMIFGRLKMEGFHVSSLLHRWPDAIKELLGYYKTGKLQTKETVTEGFENMLNGLIGILNGDNIGKAIIKV